MSTPAQDLEHLAKEAHLSLTDPEFAAFLDSRDELAYLRDEFCMPRRGDVSGEGAQGTLSTVYCRITRMNIG